MKSEYFEEDLLIGWLDFWLLGSPSLKCFPFLVVPAVMIEISVCRVDLIQLGQIVHRGHSCTCTWSGWGWCRWSSRGSCPSCWTLAGPSSHLLHSTFSLETISYAIICKSIILHCWKVLVRVRGNHWLELHYWSTIVKATSWPAALQWHSCSA